MTRDAALAYAEQASVQFRKVLLYVVYRLPAWPEDVYSVVTRDRLLSPEASTIECHPPMTAGQQDFFAAFANTRVMSVEEIATRIRRRLGVDE